MLYVCQILGNFLLFELCSIIVELLIHPPKYTIYALLNRFSKRWLAYICSILPSPTQK